MIQFNFKQCPDLIMQGLYDIDEKVFTIGNSMKADIIIQDKKIEPLHLVFECKKEGLYVSTKDLIYFQLNQKKISGKKLLKQNDLIAIGETKFTLENYLYPEHIFLHSEIPEAYRQLKNTNPLKFKIIKELERIILDIELEK